MGITLKSYKFLLTLSVYIVCWALGIWYTKIKILVDFHVSLNLLISVVVNAHIDAGNVYYLGRHETASIYSPNYPEDYSNYEDVEWFVSGPVGYRIVATFQAFHIENNYDYLDIGHGLTPDTESTMVDLTGSSIPEDVVSLNNEMWLHFTSDGSLGYPGFWIEISVFDGAGKVFILKEKEEGRGERGIKRERDVERNKEGRKVQAT